MGARWAVTPLDGGRWAVQDVATGARLGTVVQRGERWEDSLSGYDTHVSLQDAADYLLQNVTSSVIAKVFYPRTGPEAFTLPAPACITCAHREVVGLDACSEHYVDVWEGAR